MGLVDQIEIGNPTQPHCATVLLLDTSGSMAGEKIAHLNTDGAPTDMVPGDATWNQVVTRVHGGEAEKKFLFFAVAVEPADTGTLTKIAPPSRPPVKLIGTRFAELFSWLSKSQSKVSSSKIGENVALENPVVAGWGEISA